MPDSYAVADTPPGLGFGLAQLAELGLARLSLPEVLAELARIVDRLVPSLGVVIRSAELDRAGSWAGTTEVAQQLEEAQQQLAEGPALAPLGGVRVWVGQVDNDARWPRFGPRAGRLGVHAAMCFDLTTAGHSIGSGTCYLAAEGQVQPGHRELLDQLVDQLALQLETAQELAIRLRELTNLQWRIEHDAVLNQAVGILLSRQGCTPEQAMTSLRESSQRRNEKMTTVAQRIVDDAARTARARVTVAPRSQPGVGMPGPRQ